MQPATTVGQIHVQQLANDASPADRRLAPGYRSISTLAYVHLQQDCICTSSDSGSRPDAGLVGDLLMGLNAPARRDLQGNVMLHIPFHRHDFIPIPMTSHFYNQT